MKVFVLAPQEDWICDRLAKEWYESFPEISTQNPYEADVIWILAGWCWNHLPQDLLRSKKVIVTEHHIVPEKFNVLKHQDFVNRDQFVDAYHVFNEKTKILLTQITKKDIKVIPYWCNDNLWIPSDKIESRKKLSLDLNKFYIGSFQRDTEGFDLKTPKLEKGPDLFCDYLIRNRSKFEENKKMHVILGGFRRQYVKKRLEEENIEYTLYEKVDLETVRMLYTSCDLYIVSSRIEGGPQAIIEASSMKVPLISTDVGIAKSILSENCIIDINKDFYLPNEKDINYAFQKIRQFCIKDHGNQFIKFFNCL